MTASDAGPSNELQTLVETLSLAIDRPVLLDDAALVPIAYSRQWGEIDEVRESSILGRGAEPRVRESLLSQGIARASGPVRTSAVPELGMSERVCVPVRSEGMTLGFIWLVDPSETVDDEAMLRVRQAAGSAAKILAARPDSSLERGSELVAELCSGLEAERQRAIERVTSEGLFADRELVAVRVAGLEPGVRLGDFARRISHRVSAGAALAGHLAGGLLIVLDPAEPVLSVLEPARLAHWVHQAADSPIAIGESGVVGGLREVLEGRRQADLALAVAVARPQGEEYASWEELGADRIVGQLPRNALADVPAGLRQLIDGEPELTQTLSAFLESAGDVKRTAQELTMHRSGVYYRLQRIEELTGLDLSHGDDRLLAQLALRLAGRSS